MDDLSGLTKGLGDLAGGGGDADASGDTSGAGADPSAALSALVGGEGGLDGLLDQLRAAGLGDQVDSWIGTGDNQPIDAQQLGAALGPDAAQRLSSSTGLDLGQLLPLIAAFLPQIVNMLTPNGSVPDGGLNGAASSAGVPDIGSVLGGLLGASDGSGGTGTEPGLDDLLGGLGGLLGGSGS